MPLIRVSVPSKARIDALAVEKKAAVGRQVTVEEIVADLLAEHDLNREETSA